MDSGYQTVLKQQCKPNDITSLVALDANNATAFDLGYYSGLSQKKGLLTSDVALLDDTTTNAYVLRQTNSTSTNEFFADFATSFILMGKIGALTHTKGEIRKQCSVVNPPSAPSSSPVPSPNSAEMRSAFSSLLSLCVVLTYFFFQYYWGNVSRVISVCSCVPHSIVHGLWVLPYLGSILCCTVCACDFSFSIWWFYCINVIPFYFVNEFVIIVVNIIYFSWFLFLLFGNLKWSIKIISEEKKPAA